MPHSYAAEVTKLVRRPAVWVVFGLWLALMLSFTYVFPYVSYRSASSAGEAAGILAGLVPSQLPGHAIGGFPLWGGALIVVLGALCLGSEYGWGTVKTLLSFRPGRLTVYGSQLAALATAVAALVLAAFALSGLSSVLIAGSTGASMTAPAALDLVRAVAAGWLVLLMWCLFGGCLAVLFRGPALAIGLGLVWVLAVENLIRAVAPLIGAVAAVEKVLPGAGATSLVAALGGGGSAVVGEGRALALVAVYLVLFGTAGAIVWWRRDVH